MLRATLTKSRLLGWLIGLLLAVLLIGLLGPILFPWPTSRPPRDRTRTDLANLQAALEAYRTMYNRYPSGNEAHILSVLTGDNPAHYVFFTLQPRDLNAAGEYLDPWHILYRITFDAAGQLRIYSCGPNRRDDQGRKGSDDITLDDPALVGRPIP